jgi:hypothetical protein
MKPILLTFLTFTLISCGTQSPNLENTKSGSTISSWIVVSSISDSNISGTVSIKSNWDVPIGSWGAIGKSCIRIYDFPLGENGESNGKSRRFEFTFRGSCPPKSPIDISKLGDVPLFRTSWWQRAGIDNFLVGVPSGVGFVWGRGNNWKYKDSWKINGLDMNISWWQSEIFDMEQERGILQETFSIDIKYAGIFRISIEDIPNEILKQEYDDLLWAMKYGFREIWEFDSKNLDRNKTNFGSGFMEVFDENGINKSFHIDRDLTTLCNDDGQWKSRHDWGCSIESINTQVIVWIFWESNSDLVRYEFNETHYETTLTTGETKKIKESHTCNEEGNPIPCQ